MIFARAVSLFLAVACLVAVCSTAAVADDTIGVIRNTGGTTFLIRDGKHLPASPGTRIHAGDTLNTLNDGSIGFVLRDNSILAIGPDSSLIIKKFQFDPTRMQLALVARLSRGTLEYVGGVIGRLAPESVRFEMPAATIHTRGTHFLMMAEEAAVR